MTDTLTDRRMPPGIVLRNIRRYPVEPLERRSYVVPQMERPVQYIPASSKRAHRQMLCLLIAAHDEKLVIAKTLQSAIAAGMDPVNIYVVDDNSSDNTSEIAKSILPAENVIRVKRSGKGLAITKAAKRFRLTKRYRWIHIADADGAFAPDYFNVFRGQLRSRYAAATGYVRSLPGKRVSEYRVFEYTIGMEIHRRLQVIFNVMPVIPGPTSCFRWDVFEKVNFNNHSLTEDFDVTMQLHRKNLGRIQFIPDAVAYTQDPRNVASYVKQISRWNRGGLQSMIHHKVGRKMTAIDAYLTYQIMQNLLFFVSYFIWIPFLAATRHTNVVIATAFVTDVFVTFFITLFAAIRSRRWEVVSAFPQVYILRWLSLGVFLKAFVEVVFLRKFRYHVGPWENKRYVVNQSMVDSSPAA